LLALSFSFSQYLGLCVFFTLLPVIKLIKDHWHGSRHNLQSWTGHGSNTNYIVMSKRRPHFFFQNNLTFVIQMLINVFPRIVFVFLNQ
jgi:hypothetical protein